MSNISITRGIGVAPVSADIEFVSGNDNVPVPPDATTRIWNLLGDNTQGVNVTGDIPSNTSTITVANTTTSSKGVAQFNPADFTVSAGVVSLIGTMPGGYKNVTFGDSPYTVLSTDYFISVDATGGAVTINLPDTPTTDRQFIIKDRLGQALINNITIKSLGGVTTIDQQASYVFDDAYGSLECLFNSSNYEVF